MSTGYPNKKPNLEDTPYLQQDSLKTFVFLKDSTVGVNSSRVTAVSVD